MSTVSIFVLVMCSVVVTAFARKQGWPAPLLVTALALGVSFIPGVPDFEIEPELILTLVLPPLLYSSAIDISFVNFRRNLPQIRRLGLILPIVSTFVTGMIAYWLIPEMTWPTAFLLGAIVSPPDAVSAGAIGRKLGLPRNLMTVISGESLINDAASLTLFKVFLSIVGGAAFSLGHDLGIFALAVVVGIAVGIVLGLAYHAVRMRLKDPTIETLLGLLLPFFAYVGAEELSGSGVLAVVAAGLLVGYRSPATGYATRLQERPVWASLDVALEGFVFAIIGLQLESVVADVIDGGRNLAHVSLVALAVLGAVVLVRPAFVFGTYHVARLNQRLLGARWASRERDGRRDRRRFSLGRLLRGDTVRRVRTPELELSWRELTVLSWTGMRGVVTLATAVSVPMITRSGVHIAAHDTILFIAFTVTIGTLLLQGLTLPLVIRSLGVIDPDQDARDREEERRLYQTTLDEGLAYVEKKEEGWREKHGDQAVDRALRLIRERLERQERELQEDEDTDERTERAEENDTPVDRSASDIAARIVRLRRDLLRRRREILLRERNAGHLDEEVMREVLRGLDAEELALDTSPVVRHG
jgi:CPA1 family monovalent cation:H+ antiporter